ncbi:MAG TPA: HAD family hydrolase [Elusimicrobiales bacterium]|nr:HAD family hydrolase [Elusimicrobiales bacterium]
MNKNKAVLLDRDGTLIYDRPGYYLTDPKKLKILKDTPLALKLLTDLGFKLFIVSNQSAIGRGFITEQRARQINKKLSDGLKPYGIKITGIYYCPHSPAANCSCRKPKTALGKQIIKKYKLDPKLCYMIGDKNTDLKFGYNLNMKTVLVKTGHGRDELKLHKKLKADFMAKNILSAAKWIKKNEI